MGIFSFNSPFMSLLTKAANYMLLNLLALVCSIPIVTIGASTTAKYYVAMKMVRGEEPTIWKPFFKAFRQNFKQSTIIWLLEVVVAVVFIFDWQYMLDAQLGTIGGIIKIALIVFTVLCFFAGLAAFPLIARYEMRTIDLIRAAFMFAFLHPIIMLIVVFWIIAPFWLTLRFPNWLIGIWPVLPTLGMYFSAKLFMKQFSRLEEAREKEMQKRAGNSGEGENEDVSEEKSEDTSEDTLEDKTVDLLEQDKAEEYKDA